MSERVKIEILHGVFGSIIWEDGELSVRKPDVAERINWILKHQDDYPDFKDPHTGIQGRLIAALEVMGLSKGITNVTRTGGQEMPPGTVY